MFIRFQPVVNPWFPEMARSDRWMRELLNDSVDGEFASGWGSLPRVDVADAGEEFVVLVELPGVKKEDLKISVREGVLAIGGEKRPKAKPEDSRWLRNEIAAGKFQRSIELPAPVNGAKITATLIDGILRVTLPKAEEARPREITIQ